MNTPSLLEKVIAEKLKTFEELKAKGLTLQQIAYADIAKEVKKNLDAYVREVNDAVKGIHDEIELARQNILNEVENAVKLGDDTGADGQAYDPVTKKNLDIYPDYLDGQAIVRDSLAGLYAIAEHLERMNGSLKEYLESLKPR